MDLSSLIWQVVQLESTRSSNVVLNETANMRDKINTAHLNLIVCVPLEPWMVCAWLLALPKLTIGSTRASRTGWLHDKRQKA